MSARSSNHSSKRYLGLELAGAKNSKTAFAVIEYYPQEKKTFLLEVFEKLIPAEGKGGDESVLELLEEFAHGSQSMGVNVPLTLPPCVPCVKKTCPSVLRCSVPTVKWMRDFMKKTGREFTPYTQRPVELWTRHKLLPELPVTHRFEVDEALGGNKAPLTARVSYLKRHFKRAGVKNCVEVWPKLSISLLAMDLGLQKRVISNYRRLEQGGHFREEILHAMTEKFGIFIYERDMRKLSQNLAAFDAFICSYTALLADLGKCQAAPKGFPVQSGWISFPKAALR